MASNRARRQTAIVEPAATAEQVEAAPRSSTTELTPVQRAQLCSAAATWHTLTRTAIAELVESIDRTVRAMQDEQSPLREHLDHYYLMLVLKDLQQAELRFPDFGNVGTSASSPDLLELVRSFK